MRIKQGVLFIKYKSGGSKWWRISRQNIDGVFNRTQHLNNLYYCKLFLWDRKNKIAGKQVAYFYFKDGIYTKVEL